MIRQILGLRMSDQDKIKQGAEFFRPSFHIFGNVLYFNVRRVYFNVRSLTEHARPEGACITVCPKGIL